MTRPLTKHDAKEYVRRWRRVNEREIEDLRKTTLQTRWLQFNSMLNWARQFGWFDALREGESEVRRRWAKIRKAHSVKNAQG